MTKEARAILKAFIDSLTETEDVMWLMIEIANHFGKEFSSFVEEYRDGKMVAILEVVTDADPKPPKKRQDPRDLIKDIGAAIKDRGGDDSETKGLDAKHAV